MLREDNTVFFGAIDYDVKNMDHVKAEDRIRHFKLPLVLCRSKSGGGHFYCFTSEPVPASVMRDRLSEWTALLGMSVSTEQFPKQTSRYSETDVGNWINLPYFNAAETNRFAYHNGQPLELDEFLDYAESQRQTADQMEKPVGPAEGETIFVEGPPCLQTIEAMGGFVQGTKKDGMFDVAVYLRKRYPDDWQDHVDGFNRQMANIQSDEVQGIIKQVGKKAYGYKCKVPPINAYCNRRLCRTRQYGVGETEGADARGYSIGALTRYESSHGDEPFFAMEVNGKRVMVTTQQLYSRDEFNRACISQANVIPVHMTPIRWLKFLNELLPTADIVPLPEDASALGQLWEHIVMFLTQSVMATERAGIVMGVPFREEGFIYFRSPDLFQYLNARRVPYKSPQMVWEMLRQHRAVKVFWNVGGRGINVWGVPAPEQDEINSAAMNTETDLPPEAF